MLNYTGKSSSRDYSVGILTGERIEERFPFELEEMFVKFKLNFLPEKEFIARIIDMSPTGLSFKFDGIKEGLTPGTLLKNVMVGNDKHQKQISNSSVVYCNRVPFGAPDTFVTGVKFNIPNFEQSIVRRRLLGAYRIRMPRYEMGMWERLFGPLKWKINFLYGEEISSKELVDISKSGIAFKVYKQEGKELKKGDVLKNFTVFLENDIVYFGKATISSLQEEPYGIIVRCSVSECIDLEKAFSLAGIKRESRDIGYFISDIEKLKTVGKEFKLEVADLKLFLEKIKEKLDAKDEELNKKADMIDKDREYKIILDGIFDSVFPVLDRYFLNIWELVRDLNEDDYSLHKHYFQKQLLDLFLLCPFNRRALSKPLGYVDDYIMMDMLYDDPEQGDSIFSRLISKHAYYQKVIKSVRNRIAFIMPHFNSLIKEHPDRIVKIMSVGCGPAREIREFIINNNINIERYHFTLIDADKDALFYSQRTIAELFNHTDKKIKIDLINRSVAELLSENCFIDTLSKYDLIYSFGLFDYFTLSLSKRFTTCLYDFLKPGKKLIISNFNHGVNENKVYMDFILEWPVLYRTKDDMLKFTEQLPTPRNIYFETDETKTTNFLIIEKGE